jgi:gamma-butyrobetaine dioxygenase
MEISVENNQDVQVIHQDQKIKLHPVWLRERIKGKQFIDNDSHQRLYEPSSIKIDLKIKSAKIEDTNLNVEFDDGTFSEFNLEDLYSEIDKQSLKKGPLPSAQLWNSDLNILPEINFENNMVETKEMLNLLNMFYTYGFVLIRNVPTTDKYLLEFVNSIGPVRSTNFGMYFDVRSKPNPNDLAYKPIALPPHTDNPYRMPVPGIQFLHCLKNEVSGGYSTLVDGFAVAEYLRHSDIDSFKVLTSTKVRFQFKDDSIVLENWGELIELDEDQELKQVRYSTRVEYVPPMEQEKLNHFYKARKILADLYTSSQFELKFKLKEGDIMMFDNRLLHGRTAYDPNEGLRHLQGCYLDFDSTNGKIRHLKRKFI